MSAQGIHDDIIIMLCCFACILCICICSVYPCVASTSGVGARRHLGNSKTISNNTVVHFRFGWILFGLFLSFWCHRKEALRAYERSADEYRTEKLENDERKGHGIDELLDPQPVMCVRRRGGRVSGANEARRRKNGSNRSMQVRAKERKKKRVAEGILVLRHCPRSLSIASSEYG